MSVTLFEVANATGGRIATVLAAHAAAVIDRDADAIYAAAQQLEQIGALLSAAEREITNLVAAGLSNRDIADRLTVPVRTVECHLYRACTKLDCTDRDQLAAVIRSHQPR